jgi:hypothetical protein
LAIIDLPCGDDSVANYDIRPMIFTENYSRSDRLNGCPSHPALKTRYEAQELKRKQAKKS